MKFDLRHLRARDERVKEAHFQYTKGIISRREFLRFSAARWRGSLTHVPSGKRRYFHDLDEIQTTLMPYLEAMGLDMTAKK